MTSKIVVQCAQLLIDKNLKIAFAESATAGRLAAEFSLAENAGDCLLGGLVCYDACIKQNLLNVPEALIDQFTAESAEVTKAITSGLKKYFDADIVVGVTGLAKPGGSETPQKPVGTMFFHFIIHGQSYTHREVFKGAAEEIILQAIDRIAQLVIQYLKQADTQLQ
ncbi:CinA family protein [Alkanindiges sp. WGS2144]|uniref:CinA family protein n=1 Tax=Alkanindiges sp. WGS2144 TaxID=3366808 RepID=UPI00375242D1